MEIDKHIKKALIILIAVLVFSSIVLLMVPSSKFLGKITGGVIFEEVELEKKYCEENDFIVKTNYECIGQLKYYGCHRTDNGDLYQKGSLCLYRKWDDKKICISEDFCGEGAGSLSQIECVSDSEYKTKWYGCLAGCKDGACVKE